MNINKRIRQNIRMLRFRNGIYLNNPKAACSTIKNTLLYHEQVNGNIEIANVTGRQLHDPMLSIFTRKSDRLMECAEFTFSFVRNPFTRTVAAYRDKIVRRTPDAMRFRALLGFPEDGDVAFTDFLKAIGRSTSEDDDPHWRPQSDNLMIGKMPIHFVGRLENFDDDFAVVSKRLSLEGGVHNFGAHATGSGTDIREYFRSDEAVRLVTEKYHEDFANFGYDRSPTVRHTMQMVREFPGSEEFLSLLADKLE